MANMLVLSMLSYCSASTVGMLYVKGDVQVDGIAVKDSLAVTAGSVIKVADNGTANLKINSTSIYAVKNTSFRYSNPFELVLDSGGLFVNTDEQVQTNLGNCGSVAPVNVGSAGKFTKYEIQVEGSKGYVYARELPVTVKAGGKVIELQSGTVAVIEGFGNPNCTAMYYDSMEKLPESAKAILIGSYTAAIVFAAYPYDQAISASKP
ncbi:MAG TPA: hypothetical protein VN577_07395 [Terriglobales bacterium]|nr:hypothetical protein [Terriglobales bacterium]